MGSLYRPTLKSGRPGSIYWMKYYVDGRPIRESTETGDRERAKRVLKAREGAVATGQPILPRIDRITYNEVAEDLRAHYQTTGRRRIKEADKRLAHLTRFFIGYRAARIGGAELTAYIASRQGQGAANGTINRELSVLGRMLRLAYEHGKCLRVPVIRLLKEASPRQGFFERSQYEAVRRRLPPDLQVAVAIAYTYGWRVQEILGLERRHVDLDAGTLRLDPGTTKNRDGRVVYLTPDLAAQIAGQFERVRAVERRTGRIIPYAFPHLSGRRRQGSRRSDFRKTWAMACRRAGCPGMLRQDFRRTAARNLVNAGVPERVAMAILGHKTRSVFDRYHIVSPGDLREAARRLDGHVSGHVRPEDVARRAATMQNNDMPP